MKLRKNTGSKKREKSLEISRFLAVWLAKRLFPSLGSKLTCQYGRAAGYSPTAKIPPPAAGECKPTHLRRAQMPGGMREPPQPTEKPPRRVAFLLAGVAGFGPTDAGVKVPCLTAWRHPKTTVYYNTVRQGVSSVFCQLRGGAGKGGMFRTRSFPGDPV